MYYLMVVMVKLGYNESIVGKSFEYWQNIYDKGIIEEHAVYVRLNNLKYAVDKNLITSEEYHVHRSRIKPFGSSSIDYNPHSLMSFSKRLKNCLTDHQKVDQSFHFDQYVEKNIVNVSENITSQNRTTIDLNEYYRHKRQECNETKVQKKSKKKRKIKKNVNRYTYSENIAKTKVTEIIDDDNARKIENSSKQNMVVSKNAVKIFERKINKKHKNETVNKKSKVSTKKSVRDIFSRIVKQLKMDRQNLANTMLVK